MNTQRIAELWQDEQVRFLSQSKDTVTVYYKPIKSGTSNSFDSFFSESTDSTDPSNTGVSETVVTPVIVNGKAHTDLYGLNISTADSIERMDTGSFQQGDAMFTCLLSVATTQGNKTVFHTADYIVLSKDGERYNITSIKKRGIADAFLVDVFLKLTNK